MVFQTSGGVQDGKSFSFQWARRRGDVWVSAVESMGGCGTLGAAWRGPLPCSLSDTRSFGGNTTAHTVPENTPSYQEKIFRK